MKNKSPITLVPLFIIVISNYIAQIPYAIHQYHGHVDQRGSLLLLLTLLWFLIGYLLTQRHKKIGYWLLLSFLLVQSIFYFQNEVLLSFYGYGILYHFLHNKDWILWLVFLVGDINFFTACFYSVYLLKKKTLFF